MNIPITMILKNGGFKTCVIPLHMLTELASTIAKDGSGIIYLKNDTVEVSGFLVKGEITSPGIIILDDKNQKK